MPDGSDVRMTLNYILDSSKEKFGDLGAIGMAMEKPLTYAELHERICGLAAGLMARGLGRGDRVAILAENSHNWGTAYLSVVRFGGIGVPILPELPEADVHHILGEMQVQAIFTTQRQVEKIYDLGKNLPELIITLDDSKGVEGLPETETFSAFLEASLNSYREQQQNEEAVSFPEIDEEDLASILYTSGTSGFSKAVMLSHRNLTSNAYAASGLMDIEPGSVFLSILPISHTYEFTTGFILPLLTGARIAYAGKTPTPAILQNLCTHERPYIIFAVPLVLEKIYKKRVLPNIEKSALLRALCTFGYGRKFVHKKAGKKLLKFFGGNLAMMGIGGASLNPEVEQFLVDAEFPYLIGYGQTESSPLIAGGPFKDKTIAIGSTGKPLPGVEVRIENSNPETGVGEIYVRGANVMIGYFGDEDATAEAISPDGWLATGDLGVIDEQGNLHIKGRCKNIIVMASGENIYPEAIEHKINGYNWVVESLVVEDNGKLNAWIYPDYEYIDEVTAGKSRSQRREYLDGLFDELRREINATQAATAKLAEVFERREPFIKTATHKIKRYLYDRHAHIA